jgi:hypothetical protein
MSEVSIVDLARQPPRACLPAFSARCGKHSFKMKRKENPPAANKPLSADDLSQIRWASGTNILLGIWLFIASLLLVYPQPSIRWNDMIAGVVLSVLATLRYLRPVGRFRLSVINAGIGVWLIAAPFVLHCQHMMRQLNDMTVGIVVFVAGVVSASVRSFGR